MMSLKNWGNILKQQQKWINVHVPFSPLLKIAYHLNSKAEKSALYTTHAHRSAISSAKSVGELHHSVHCSSSRSRRGKGIVDARGLDFCGDFCWSPWMTHKIQVQWRAWCFFVDRERQQRVCVCLIEVHDAYQPDCRALKSPSKKFQLAAQAKPRFETNQLLFTCISPCSAYVHYSLPTSSTLWEEGVVGQPKMTIQYSKWLHKWVINYRGWQV